MSSRDDILKAVRARPKFDAPLPDMDQEGIRYDDPFAQFKTMIEFVGGRCTRLPRSEIGAYLATIPEYASAPRIVSTVAEVASTFDMAAVSDPHELEPVDWAILPVEFGVAENGAVWATDEQLKHRVIYFIVQHLAIVLPASQIVNNMHEAYDRITVGKSSLGMFLSGPSKTADIEQSLVIGAHGPRSLTVLCVEG